MRVLWLVLIPVLALGQQSDYVTIPAGGGRPSFELMKVEVSVEAFAKFARTTGYRTVAEQEGAARTWRAPGFRIDGRQPVVLVTPADAMAYCSWAGARLPNEAEWEHAARAGSTTRHFWGERLDGRYLWYRENSGGRPRAVGTRRPNRWGLHDMAGNVWEWVAVEDDGAELRVARRGASWVSCENITGGPGREDSPLIGTAVRFAVPLRLNHRHDDIGFRCAR